MVEQAYAQLKEGHFEDAIQAFSKCLLLEPSEARAYSGRGTAHLQLRKWQPAAFDFSMAHKLDPADAESRIGLAISLASDNRIYEAIDVFEALLADHPHFVRARIQFAQLYYHMGVITKGHQELDAALASRPSLAERRTIEQLKKEQLTLDKKRYYRPDFEALRRQNRPLLGDFFKKLGALFGRKPKN